MTPWDKYGHLRRAAVEFARAYECCRTPPVPSICGRTPLEIAWEQLLHVVQEHERDAVLTLVQSRLDEIRWSAVPWADEPEVDK